MDTRSRKSRSSTPFTQVEDFSKEFLEKEALAESSVRVTRRTITSKVKESQSESIDEVTSSSKILKKLKGASKGSEKKSRWYKTSDYSSEEGENEVSSSRNLSQDEKNQMIEDAKAAANGTGEVSALSLYKQAGTYWELYPKTDYTYSPFSKDRVELAPGVVAMPNMSRKTIHSLGSRSTEVENKETNTDSSYFSRNAAQLYANYMPRQLFNNNYEHTYARTSIKSVTLWSRVKTTTITTITTILTTLITVFYAGFRVQRSWLSKLHKFTSNVMMLDTWLLWKNNAGNKGYKLVALCLIPLLLLGGMHLLLVSGVSLVPSCHPNCRKIASNYIYSLIDSAYYNFFNKTESV